ncbi:hypothetical protein HYW42_01650 [Candidatus Daviesbacteria bacterium]|nr:hypothetical protein [Candidatus Daviesbacteria bacterium]
MTRKDILIIAIATFVTICSWVLFDVLHARSQVEIPAKTKEIIEPINPNFDLSGLEGN